jgi:hypothetical protein
MSQKPLGRKNYGHIPHLPNSRMGSADKHCQPGQAKIATVKTRDRLDTVIVQEKLDGSNVGIVRLGHEIIPIARSGYRAESSPYNQHHQFARWLAAQYDRAMAVLQDGERLVGEWLYQAHGTRYRLTHEPFVAFDLMREDRRLVYDQFCDRVAQGNFTTPHVLHRGDALAVDRALALLGTYGHHGALEPVEGVVYRVERDRPRQGLVVDFLVKYVRPDKQDGIYLPEFSGQDPVFNQSSV